MRKKIAVVLAVLALCAAFAACGNDEYAGTYKTNFTDITGRTTISLTLKKNGKFTMHRLGEGETEEMLEEGLNLYLGTYSVKDGAITLKMKYRDAAAGEDVTESFVGTVLSNGNIKIELFARSNLLIKQKD